MLLAVAIPEKRWKLKKTIELFKAGHSINEIAKMLRKSRGGVGRQLRQQGLLPPLDPAPIRPGKKVLRGKGRWNSPYGFMYERGRPIRHPQEYETFRIIMDLWKSGQSAREIADRLNELRLRPRLAKLWDRSTVHRIIEWHRVNPDFEKEALTWESKDSSQ